VKPLHYVVATTTPQQQKGTLYCQHHAFTAFKVHSDEDPALKVSVNEKGSKRRELHGTLRSFHTSNLFFIKSVSAMLMLDTVTVPPK
jgi:hypothetical protein